MFALARSFVAGRPSPYDVAARIRAFLLANYTYDEHPPARPYPLESFLFEDRRGYCQQFSGAMALMLRMDGIPARVAAGFKPGIYDAAAAGWSVRALDAHSWVEVYFTGIGWVAFDPTPPRAVPLGREAAAALSKGALLRGQAGASKASTPAGRAALAAAAAAGVTPAWVWIAAATVLATLALALSCWLRGAVRMRRALAHDGAGAVAELQWALARAGRPIGPAATLSELERELTLAGANGEAAVRYLRLLRDARFSARPGLRPRARDRRALRRALAHRSGLRTRIALLWAMPPGATRRAAWPPGGPASG
jgi:hypothetical protein